MCRAVKKFTTTPTCSKQHSVKYLKTNKRSKNFDERQHRTSCRYWRLKESFCCVHCRQTHRPRYMRHLSVAIGHIYATHAMRLKNEHAIHHISGINSPYLFVNLIMAPVPPFPTHLFIHPSLLPLLIHHSAHP